MVILGLGTLVAIPLLRMGCRVRSLLDDAVSMNSPAPSASQGDDATAQIGVALRRIVRFLRLAGLFLVSFLAVRVAFMTTATKGLAPVQGHLSVYLTREIFNVLYYIAVACLLVIPMLTYVGGPARARLAAHKSRAVRGAPWPSTSRIGTLSLAVSRVRIAPIAFAGEKMG